MGWWFGRKSAPADARPFVPAWLQNDAAEEGFARSYSEQFEEVYRRNPVGQRAVRLVAGMLGSLTVDGDERAVKLVKGDGLLEGIAANLLLHGNAYVKLLADDRDRPRELCALRPERVALCWRLERTDGAGIALTSHDQQLVVGGVAFEPAPGMMPASITRSLGLEPDSSEIAGALSSDALEENDLAVGRWDGAGMQLSVVDWSDPAAETIVLLGGEIGTVAIDGNGFTADLQGAAARLEEAFCPATSPECRAQFGDKQCRVDLAGRTIVASVVETTAGELTLDRSVDDRFVLGRLRYVSGANCGRSSVILSVDGTVVQVRDLPRAPVENGCRVEIREGCDKRFETCVSRFNNAVNFRGEPHLPGNDLLTRYPGA